MHSHQTCADTELSSAAMCVHARMVVVISSELILGRTAYWYQLRHLLMTTYLFDVRIQWDVNPISWRRTG
jgi:hypothetical protein